MAVMSALLSMSTGLKYASENVSELKDKMDFVQNDPSHFPPGGSVRDILV